MEIMTETVQVSKNISKSVRVSFAGYKTDKEALIAVKMNLCLRETVLSEVGRNLNSLLGYNVMDFGDIVTFWRNILSPSSGSRVSKARNWQKQVASLAQFAICFLLVSCLPYNSALKMEGVCSSKKIRLSAIYTALQTRRPHSS
jgi:hypothetical protein